MIRRCCLVLVAMLASGLFCGPIGAGVYNLHLVTDNVPDYTDLPSLVESATGNWQTPQDKCIAIWRWGRRARHQMSCATEGGRYILDPILHFNSYGAMNCGIISLLNIACWRQLGYPARYVQLGDHTVSEVSWDNGKTWHLFDSSMSIYCFNHDGQVASCEEIKEAHACELSGGKSEPGHYYLYHYAPVCGTHPGPSGWRCAADQPVAFNRTLEAGASSYTDGFDVDRYCQNARYGHRYVLNLRPYESYTRYWTPLNRDQQDTESDGDLAYFRPMPNGSDPDGPNGENHIRGNGRWVFEPNLAADDCRRVFYEAEGVTRRSEDGASPNLHPAGSATPGWVVFKVDAANVIASMRLEATGQRLTSADSLSVSVSRDAGLHWRSVWSADGTGPQRVQAVLREEVAGVTQCLVKIEMRAAQTRSNVGLDSLRVVTITQLDRLTLPKLTVGTNEILLRADEQVETTELWPILHAGAYRQTAIEENNVFSDKQPDGMYKATLGAGVDGRECSVTWRLAVPTDVTTVTYGAISTNRTPQSWVSLRRSWDGENFAPFHLNKDGDFPFDEQVLQSFADAPIGTRQAHVRGVFFCKSDAATYNMPGLQDLLIRICHKPRDVTFQPIEVTYHWTEHRPEGGVIRSHTELVRSLPHRYTINVAGRRDPTMHWVRMNLQGHGPGGKVEPPGYSDGTDVGPGWERAKVTYRWSKNLALGKTYTASRVSNSSSGNPDSDGRELTNGFIIAPTDYVRDRTIQAATAFWDAGEPVAFVVDLEHQARMAGVRVSTHQPNANLCHPASIEVTVSEDGQQWLPAGTIRHDDVWNPPGDYEPWEHDDSPAYRDLPAGGRLAYSFPLVFPKPLQGRYVRFVCTPLDGKDMGISELQAFERIEVSPWPADIHLPAPAPPDPSPGHNEGGCRPWRMMADDTPRFGMFETSFRPSGAYDNSYKDLAALAVLHRPDGKEWRIPLFWDGQAAWTLRVSPDLIGEWSYAIRSTDAGLNAKTGSFRCVASNRHGSIQPMRSHPLHFEYQDGTPFWFFGEKAWRVLQTDPAEKLDHETAMHHVDVRAGQGFNYLHTELAGTGGLTSGGNEGGEMFLDAGKEIINPAFFREVDSRLRHINDKGLICGMVLLYAKGDPCWKSLPDDEARLRFARYVVARYAAFDIVFLVAGEWHFMAKQPDLFRAIGREIFKTDPHRRMIGIHPGPESFGISSQDFAEDDWMSFGEYAQAYFAPHNQEATDANRDSLRKFILAARKHNKPVVDAEYAYYLRDQDYDGIVDKPHSHTRDSFRRASWAIAMGGGYFVTGFGTTYFGGRREVGPFLVDNPRHKDAVSDLDHLHTFFTSLPWWRLEPHDEQVTPDGGYAYCLADAGKTYVIYIAGGQGATLRLAGGEYSLCRYDPRTGRPRELSATGGDVVHLAAPDTQDWVFLVKATARASAAEELPTPPSARSTARRCILRRDGKSESG